LRPECGRWCRRRGLVFVEPDLAFFEFPEPALDEGLGLEVAAAAAAATDLELAEPLAEAAGGEAAAVVRASVSSPDRIPYSSPTVVDDGDRFITAAAEFELPAHDLGGAAAEDRVQVTPAVLAYPDRGHVELPELP
jgi:hypothetical protein